MNKAIKDAVILAVFGIVLAFVANSVSPKGISLVGTWYDNREKQQLDIPPSYDPTTDSLLTMNEAFNLWQEGAVFIDAREPEDYERDHIPGAISLPFDYWDDYWAEVEPRLAKTDTIVCYCGGFDCELSLFAARELKVLGYNNSLIFFGGINKWEEAKLPLEYGSEGTENEDEPASEE